MHDDGHSAGPEARFRKVTFLDTNVLHWIGLYLHQAEKDHLFPLEDKEEDEARRHLRSLSECSFRKGLFHGLNAIVYLSKEDRRVECSLLTELELMAGRGKGKAYERAAAEGIPDRMWTRFDEKEVNNRLRPEDRTAIRERIGAIMPALAEANIRATVASPAQTRDAIELALDIAESVYLSPADSVVYAGALVAGADELLSGDRYLMNTVNRIKSNEEFKFDRIRLQKRVAGIISIEPEGVILPKARRIPKPA